MARGNGKTSLAAALCTAAIDPEGPLSGGRGEVILLAPTQKQARVAFRHVKFLTWPEGKPDDRRVWRVSDTVNLSEMEHRATGALLSVMACRSASLHGYAPSLVILDEPAQWPPSESERVLSAVLTSTGKLAGCRILAVGTRPAGGSHWFARWIDGEADYVQSHAARTGDPPYWRRTWKRANPSLDHMPDLEAAIRREAELSKRSPKTLPGFMALRLNTGTSDHDIENVLLTVAEWRSVEVELGTLPPRSGPLVMGLDIGGSKAMTAACAYWPDSGRVEVVAAFGSVPSLTDRGRWDGVTGLYESMEKRGELVTLGRRAVDLEAFVRLARARFGDADLLVADRYKESELRDALESARYPARELCTRGQGYRDGAEDVRRFRRAIAEGRVKVSPSVLLRSGLAEARTVADVSGNEKLSKHSEGHRRQRARDDVISALIAAVAEGDRRRGRIVKPRARLHAV